MWLDATRTRPSDGTIWLLGRPSLEVLDTVQRTEGDPTPLRKGDKILGIASTIVTSPQTAAADTAQPGTRLRSSLPDQPRRRTDAVAGTADLHPR